MKQQNIKPARNSGFSLLEILTVIAIIALLGAVSLPMYQGYQERARAAELILIFDGLRTGLRADLEEGPYESCNDLYERASGKFQTSEDYARLSLGFQPNHVAGGYNPVFIVVSSLDREGPLGLSVARATHDELDQRGMVASGFSTSAIIAFNARLSDNTAADCIKTFVP